MTQLNPSNLVFSELKSEDAASINGGSSTYAYNLMKSVSMGSGLKVKSKISLAPLDFRRTLFKGRDNNGDKVFERFRYFHRRIKIFAGRIGESYSNVVCAINKHIADAGYSA